MHQHLSPDTDSLYLLEIGVNFHFSFKKHLKL